MDKKVITEDDIAAYLLSAPEFFERYSNVLTSIQLTSPRGQRAVSLQERQMELLREKIKGLELRMAHMIRAGSENDQTREKLQNWVLSLLREKRPEKVPALLVQGLHESFNVPQVGLRVWTFTPDFSTSLFAKPVSEDVHTFIRGMNGEPYCGHNPDLEVVSWLDDPAEIRSVALLPLHANSPAQPFGLIVLGSTDPQRFTAEMGVAILKNIAALASATLLRCTVDEM
ncbi:MAG: DUF484 family protein [Saezia sp.]